MTFPAVRGRDFNDTMGAHRNHRAEGHRGQDIPAPLGSPIVAMKSGEVKRVYDTLTPSNYCGYGISIEHPLDRLRYTYCHMHRPPTKEDGSRWEVGEQVEEGDFLGVVGTTTRLGASVGPHLHIQAISSSGAGRPVNLYPMLRRAYDRERGRGSDLAGVRDWFNPLAPHAPAGGPVAPASAPGPLLIIAGLGALWYFTKGK